MTSHTYTLKIPTPKILRDYYNIKNLYVFAVARLRGGHLLVISKTSIPNLEESPILLHSSWTSLNDSQVKELPFYEKVGDYITAIKADSREIPSLSSAKEWAQSISNKKTE